MINHYDEEKLSKIEELKKDIRDYHIMRLNGVFDREVYQSKMEDFISEYGCNYDFFCNYGVELSNSEHDDMREVIEYFVKSGCNTYDDFCIYLMEKIITIFEKL